MIISKHDLFAYKQQLLSLSYRLSFTKGSSNKQLKLIYKNVRDIEI